MSPTTGRPAAAVAPLGLTPGDPHPVAAHAVSGSASRCPESAPTPDSGASALAPAHSSSTSAKPSPTTDSTSQHPSASPLPSALLKRSVLKLDLLAGFRPDLEPAITPARRPTPAPSFFLGSTTRRSAAWRRSRPAPTPAVVRYRCRPPHRAHHGTAVHSGSPYPSGSRTPPIRPTEPSGSHTIPAPARLSSRSSPTRQRLQARPAEPSPSTRTLSPAPAARCFT